MAKRLIYIFRRGAAAMSNEIIQDTEIPGTNDFQYRTSNRFPTAHVTAAQCTSLATETAATGYKCNTAFSAFHTRWQAATFPVAAYCSIGNDNPTRSHFAEQDRLDGGGSDYATLNSGWFNRWAGLVDIRSPAYNLDIMTIGAQAARSSIGIVTLYAATLTGTPTISSLLASRATIALNAASAVAGDTGEVARQNVESALATRATLAGLTLPAASALPSSQVGSGVAYAADTFGSQMQLMARLLSAGLASRVLCIDNSEGWDHHQDMGGSPDSAAGVLGKLKHHNLLVKFNATMEAFMYDMEELGLQDDTLIVTQTEFHRTLRQNGTYGTDHGHAGHAYIWGKDVTSGLYGAPLKMGENQNPNDPWPDTVYTNPGGWNSAANNRFLRYTFEYRDFQRMCLEWLSSRRLNSGEMEDIWGPNFVSDVANPLTDPQYNSVAIV